ncbi:MAG TPA: LysE family transporter [Cytophagaceae bacterium]|nr:LysE family transporter [Cytophagaceae bacterium]
MPDYIIYFFIAAAFSYIGSVMPASGNLITIQISLSKGLKAALLFALGEVIMECIYGYVSLKISDLIAQNALNEKYLNMIVVPVFLSLAVYYFFNKKKVEEQPEKNYRANFLYGLLIGFLNPLAIPFWVFYFSYFYSNNWVVENSPYEWALVAGIPVGSFTLLLTYSLLARKVSRLFQFRIELFNKGIAVVFFLLAGYSFIRLLTMD